MEETKVSIGRDNYKTEINIRNHDLLADEPTEHGGTDTGVKGLEFLLAGLGACTAVTLRMYADRKEWPLERVETLLSMERETTQGKLTTTIDRKIELIGDLSEEQRKRLMIIADKCPVHKTLTSDLEINTSVLGI